MTNFIDVSEEALADLLAPKKEPLFYDEEQPEVKLEICEHCGACEDPQHCVWAVQCPECFAPPKEQCTNPNGGLAGLHEARHKYANSPFWQHYREG